jgi:ADP-ribose pyrophosphatase YjhB (NUDIX family)
MNKKREEDAAVTVIVKIPQGIILVKDPQAPKPLYWKFPGGHREPGESLTKAAVRELREETGFVLEPTELKELVREDRVGHVSVTFVGEIPPKLLQRRLKGIKKVGMTGEQVRLFSPSDLERMRDFFPPHKILFSTYQFLTGNRTTPRRKKVKAAT